jgi:predicted nucleotide-binding protein
MMDLIKKIEECLEAIEKENTSVKSILKRCYGIACEIQDVKHQVWYELNTTDLNTLTENKENLIEIQQKLKSITKDAELLNKIWSKIISEYWEARTIETLELGESHLKRQTNGLSIDVLEGEINSLEITLEHNTIPPGLHTLDLWEKQKQKEQIDFIVIQKIKVIKEIMGKLTTIEYKFLIDTKKRIVDRKEIKTVENNKKIFIIHGHNEAKRRELKEIIEKFKLEPLVLLDESDGGSKTIIEKFEEYANQCCYAITIFTPDDTVTHSGKIYQQARPNAIFEIGWFCGKLGRERVSLLIQDDPRMTVFSDFVGVLQKRFNKDIKEIQIDIENELKKIGILN